MKTLPLVAALLFAALPLFSQFVYDPFSLNAAELKANKSARVHLVRKYEQPKESEYTADDADFIAETEYSEGGLPIRYIERKQWDDDEDWDTVRTVTYLFSGPGDRLSLIRSVNSEMCEVVTAFTYGKKGNLLKIEVVDTVPPIYEYRYKKGRIATCKVTQNYTSYEGDTNSIEKIDGLLVSQYAFSYDKKGRISEEKMYQGEEGDMVFFRRRELRYDDKGLLSRQSVFFFFNPENGDPFLETNYFYDESGLLTKMIEIDPSDGEETTYEFRFTFYR